MGSKIKIILIMVCISLALAVGVSFACLIPTQRIIFPSNVDIILILNYVGWFFVLFLLIQLTEYYIFAILSFVLDALFSFFVLEIIVSIFLLKKNYTS